MSNKADTPQASAQERSEYVNPTPIKPRSMAEIFGGVTEESAAEESTEQEIVDDGTEEDTQSLSARTRDVDPEQLAKMYSELEKEKSRQANELGELRGLVREMLESEVQSRKQSLEKPVEEEIDWSDVPDAVQKLISKQTAPILEAVQKLGTQMQLGAVTAKRGDVVKLAQSQPFQDWVNEKAIRRRAYALADKGDFEVMDELFAEYEESTRKPEPEAQPQTERPARTRARRASSPMGNSGRGASTGGKIWSAAEIVRLRQTDREKYVELQPEIMAAYRDGRVR